MNDFKLSKKEALEFVEVIDSDEKKEYFDLQDTLLLAIHELYKSFSCVKYESLRFELIDYELEVKCARGLKALKKLKNKLPYFIKMKEYLAK